MKFDEDDVYLMNGQGYMVEKTEYERHLKNAVETTEVPFFRDN